MANPRKRKARILEALRKAAEEQQPTPEETDELMERARKLVKAAEQLTTEQIDEALKLNKKEPTKDGEKKQATEKRKTTTPKKSAPVKKKSRTRRKTKKTKK